MHICSCWLQEHTTRAPKNEEERFDITLHNLYGLKFKCIYEKYATPGDVNRTQSNVDWQSNQSKSIEINRRIKIRLPNLIEYQLNSGKM